MKNETTQGKAKSDDAKNGTQAEFSLGANSEEKEGKDIKHTLVTLAMAVIMLRKQYPHDETYGAKVAALLQGNKRLAEIEEAIRQAVFATVDYNNLDQIYGWLRKKGDSNAE